MKTPLPVGRTGRGKEDSSFSHQLTLSTFGFYFDKTGISILYIQIFFIFDVQAF
jgi:hypothetical protein